LPVSSFHRARPYSHAMTLSELLIRWRERRDDWRRLGVTVDGAKLCEEFLGDLESMDASGEEVLTLVDAALECGYSADHLGRLVREGAIPNSGRPKAPKIRRRDLPRNPGALSFASASAIVPVRPPADRGVCPDSQSQGAGWLTRKDGRSLRARRVRRACDRGVRGIFLEWWEQGPPRKRVRQACGHGDRERAKAQAEALALAFRRHERRRAVLPDLRRQPSTGDTVPPRVGPIRRGSACGSCGTEGKLS